MSSRTTVFLTGATGYVGGATLQLLLLNPQLDITVLVRSKDKADKLEQLGVKTVVGSLDDTALLEAEGTKADVVIQSADLSHIGGISALLKGAKARFEQTGKKPIFIHTSGTGAFAKLDAMGEATSEPVLSDTSPNLRDFKNQRYIVTNEALLAADEEGYVRTYLVFPSVIYGVLKGPVVDAGIAHAYSISFPWLIKLSVQRGQGAMVGKGLNRWPAVHIDDTAEFYRLLLERGLANEAPHGEQGFYVLENGELNFAGAARRYTAVLHARGKSAKPEPESFTTDEIEKISSLSFCGSEVRIRADRSRKLGWSPVHGIEDFYESVEEDTEAVLAGKN